MVKHKAQKKPFKLTKKAKFIIMTMIIAGIVPVYFMFFRDSFLFSFSTKWHFGASGYRSGLNESRIYFKPMLIVVNQSRCRLCDMLKKRLWNNNEFTESFQGLVLVELNSSASVNDLRIAKQLGFRDRAPAIFIRPKYNLPAIPLHILVELDSIWIPGKDNKSGHHAPLSPASFRLAVDETLRESKAVGSSRQN